MVIVRDDIFLFSRRIYWYMYKQIIEVIMSTYVNGTDAFWISETPSVSDLDKNKHPSNI